MYRWFEILVSMGRRVDVLGSEGRLEANDPPVSVGQMTGLIDRLQINWCLTAVISYEMTAVRSHLG